MRLRMYVLCTAVGIAAVGGRESSHGPCACWRAPGPGGGSLCNSDSTMDHDLQQAGTASFLHESWEIVMDV